MGVEITPEKCIELLLNGWSFAQSWVVGGAMVMAVSLIGLWRYMTRNEKYESGAFDAE